MHVLQEGLCAVQLVNILACGDVSIFSKYGAVCFIGRIYDTTDKIIQLGMVTSLLVMQATFVMGIAQTHNQVTRYSTSDYFASLFKHSRLLIYQFMIIQSIIILCQFKPSHMRCWRSADKYELTWLAQYTKVRALRLSKSALCIVQPQQFKW